MIKILLIVFLYLIEANSCTINSPIPNVGYCEKIELKLYNKITEQKLLSWFDENFNNQLILNEKDYYYGGLYVPGRYTYKKPFDWSILDFNSIDSVVKLIKFHEIDKNSLIYASVSSVSLAERSRVSVLIKSVEAKTFGFDGSSKYVKKITDRLAVYCLDVDS